MSCSPGENDAQSKLDEMSTTSERLSPTSATAIDGSKKISDQTKEVPVGITSAENSLKGEIRSRRRWKICLILSNTVIALVLILLCILLWYLKVIPQAVELEMPTQAQKNCLSLRISLCHKYKVPYSYTLYPNALGQYSQNNASDHIGMYEPLISVKCFPLLPLFLCSLYAPKCIDGGRRVPPCKSLCKETKRRCNFFLDVFSVSWPPGSNCETLPDSSDPEVCIGMQEMKILERSTQACRGGFRCDKKLCLPQSWVCDGFSDCSDGTDEANCSNCTTDQYYCGNDACIDKVMYCDGVRDCPDGRDERRCLRLNKTERAEEGRLEAFSLATKSWQPVCGDQWDTSKMSAKACIALGYRSVNETRLRFEASEKIPNDVDTPTATTTKMKTIFTGSREGCGADPVFVYLKCQHFECGKSANEAKISWRIVGGKESDPGAWPWLVALHGGPEKIFFCGGVLLSEWWILSAAHCVGNQTNKSEWTLKLGMTRRLSHVSFIYHRSVSELIKHPGFSSSNFYGNDIVLIRLDRPVTFDSLLRPICLPHHDQQLMKLPKNCTVIGWGKPLHDDEADYHSVVHQVEVPIVDFDTCSHWYSIQDVTISETMLCAGYPEGQKDACQGDSGGPLICKDESEHWFVAGVVSWGIKCAQPNLPGIYTNVPLYLDWILNTTREAGYPL